jgi:hypothetical protein
MIIKGNTVGTTMPRTDWNQTDPGKADYLKGKDDLANLIQEAKTVASEAQGDIDSHIASKNNPHGVTAAQAGARPNTWLPTIAEIGAAPSGYGLGKTADKGTFVDDANTLFACGYYAATVYSKNVPANEGILHVLARTGTECAQEFFVLFDGTKFRRVTIGGGSAWREWVKCDASAFAPSGYGLGEAQGKWVTDIDSAITPGFYAMGGDSVAAKLPAGYSLFGYGTLLVEKRNDYVSQTFRHNDDVAHRYSSDGGATWSPFLRRGMGIEQLWSNASPTSSFAEQTISVDWSKYDRIGVQYDRCYGEMDAKQGAACDSAWFFGNDNGSIVATHRTAEVVSGGIKITNNQTLTTGNYVTTNDRVIPLKIYGIGGVGTSSSVLPTAEGVAF